MPLPPPVMSATLPATENIESAMRSSPRFKRHRAPKHVGARILSPLQSDTADVVIAEYAQNFDPDHFANPKSAYPKGHRQAVSSLSHGGHRFTRFVYSGRSSGRSRGSLKAVKV